MHKSAVALALGALFQGTDASSFLRSGARAVTEQDVDNALSTELRAADHLDQQSPDVQSRFTSIQQSLESIYQSLPKNEHGKLSHLALRYALHRHFSQRYGWWIRGLEPSLSTESADKNAQNSSTMKEWVPSYLQDHFEAVVGDAGSDLAHVAAMGVVLQDMVDKEVAGQLQSVYDMHNLSVHEPLSQQDSMSVVTTFYIAFLNGRLFAASGPEHVKQNWKIFMEKYADWDKAQAWLNLYLEEHVSHPDNATFAELKKVALSIGTDYVDFNEKECEDLRNHLSSLEGGRPGRVRLSAFYLAGIHTHWDFNEKKEYLRNLGALDESDPAHPEVIIPNYATSKSNCLEASGLYTICCKNPCDDVMTRLESTFKEPTPTLEVLLNVLPGFVKKAEEDLAASSHLMMEDVENGIQGKHKDRLEEIAKLHGGVVPIHGRLFAQWMHNIFPFHCPFPHEFGVLNPMSADEWLEETGHSEVAASPEEIKANLESDDTCAVDAKGKVSCTEVAGAELEWSTKEELLTWNPQQKRYKQASAYEEKPSLFPLFAALLVAFGLIVKVMTSKRSAKTSSVKEQQIALLTFLSVLAYVCGLLDGQLLFCVLVCAGLVLAATRVQKKKSKTDLPFHTKV